MITKYLKVWIGNPRGVPPVIRLSQYDTAWRLVFTVYDGAELYQIPSGAAVAMEGRKADGTVFVYAGTVEDGTVTVECGEQMTSARGEVVCELRFSSGGYFAGTANFRLCVEAAPLTGYVASGDDFSAMDQLVSQALAAAGDAREAAEDSRAAAGEAKQEVLEDAPQMVSDWLDANVDPSTGYVIDSSLTVAGAAADAAAAGGKLSDLKSALDEIDNLLPTDGSSVSCLFTANTYWNTETSVAVLTNYEGLYSASDPIPVSEGERYHIVIRFGTTLRGHAVVIVDSNYEILHSEIQGSLGTFTTDVTVPTGGAYLLLTAHVTPETTSVTNISYLDVASRDVTDAMESCFPKYREVVDVTENQNKFWTTDTNPITLDDYTGQYVALSPIPVQYGDVFSLYIKVGISARQRPWVLVDEDYYVLSKADTPTGGSDHYESYTISVTDIKAKYLLVNVYGQNTDYVNVSKKTFGAEPNALNGLKLSLLGDSISSFTGTLPSGNRAYYTGSNSGVTRASQMWWNIVCEKLGLTPLVINGWSGSTVTSGVRDATTYVPSSDVSRCQALDDGVNTPDIVLIAMGVNDYSYNAPMGSWDGTTSLNDDTTTFRTAYATMLSRIQTTYPNAIVVCITPWFVERGSDTGVTFTNRGNLTESAFSDAVREIATIMNCPVIDGTNIGFNRHNYYPTYCEDSATVPTHPNASGQYVMGMTIADALERICKGFVKFSQDTRDNGRAVRALDVR